MLEELAQTLLLGSLLDELERRAMAYEWVTHWQQGEFHHDIILRVLDPPPELPGAVLVVSTNCNAGIKEVLCLQEVPRRWALWKHRCADNPEFEGELPPLMGCARTVHWFDPCELLKPDARSELKPTHRRRQRGGGWVALWRDPAKVEGDEG